jgi:hypothetical protein
MNTAAKHPDLTIVVNTCDTYQDVLGIFFHALKAHWPDCPYPVVINTETNTYQHPARVHNHPSPGGVDDWGARLLCTLKSVDTDFVLMLYDDFILDSTVSNDRITSALDLLKSHAQATVAYLIDTSLPLNTPDSTHTFVEIKARADYRLNSAPGIWRRQALMTYTAAGDTPWAWEVFGTYRTWGDGNRFYSLNPQQTDIYPYNYAKGGAIYRGKWVRDVVDQVAQAYPLNIDWSVRGFSSDTVFEKRSAIWKLRFIQTGFRMVGWRAINIMSSYLREKLNGNNK